MRNSEIISAYEEITPDIVPNHNFQWCHFAGVVNGIACYFRSRAVGLWPRVFESLRWRFFLVFASSSRLRYLKRVYNDMPQDSVKSASNPGTEMIWILQRLAPCRRVAHLHTHMSCLVRFIRFAKETATCLVRLGFIRAFLVRIPPRNYGKGSLVLPTGSLASAFNCVEKDHLYPLLPVETVSKSLDESRSDETLVNLNQSFGDLPGYAQGDLEDVDDCLFVCKVSRILFFSISCYWVHRKRSAGRPNSSIWHYSKLRATVLVTSCVSTARGWMLVKILVQSEVGVLFFIVCVSNFELDLAGEARRRRTQELVLLASAF